MPAMPTGLPGLTTLTGSSPRNIWLGGDAEFLPGGRIISGAVSRDPLNTGNVDVLRAGVLMGKITSGGKYAPSIIGVTTNAEAAGSTAIEAAAAVVTELVRRVGASGTFKLTGPPAANGVVATQTVTYSAASGTSITCTALSLAAVAGSFIQPSDGSETPLTMIEEPEGVKVTDQDSASVDVPFARVPIGGTLDSSQIVNWPSDTSQQAWIVARLNSGDTGKFVFDHKY